MNILSADLRHLYSRGDDLTFVLPGSAVVASGSQVVVGTAFTITDYEAFASSAPLNLSGTGAALVLAIMKNGVSALTITFNHNVTTATGTGLSVTFARGDRYRMDVTQIGSDSPGAGISLAVRRVYS